MQRYREKQLEPPGEEDEDEEEEEEEEEQETQQEEKMDGKDIPIKGSLSIFPLRFNFTIYFNRSFTNNIQ